MSEEDKYSYLRKMCCLRIRWSWDFMNNFHQLIMIQTFLQKSINNDEKGESCPFKLFAQSSLTTNINHDFGFFLLTFHVLHATLNTKHAFNCIHSNTVNVPLGFSIKMSCRCVLLFLTNTT